MTKINIGRYDRITIGTTEFRFVSKTDNGYILAKNEDGTDRHEHFSYKVINELLADSKIRIERNWYRENNAKARLHAGVSHLNELREEEAHYIIAQEHYIHEFLRMENIDKTVKRTDKSIRNALDKIHAEYPRLKTRCDRREYKREQPHPRTFRRWLKRYEDNGYDTLALRNNYRRCGNSDSKLDPVVEKLLHEHALLFCDNRQPSKKRIHESLQDTIKSLNRSRIEHGLEPLVCPSYSTLSKFIHALDQFEVMASREGIDKARAKFAIVSNGLEAIRPLQHVQIDEWKIQLHTIAIDIGLGNILDESVIRGLKRERVWLCALIDVATRCILGFRISREASTDTALSALAMAVTDKNEFARAAGCQSDWPMHGAIGLISPDAGGAFVSERFRAVCADLKMAYENAPSGLSHLRGHIERAFGTMHTSLAPYFSGRSFGDIVKKGDYKSQDLASILTTQLPQIVTRWVVDIYHRRPHAGLRGETPYDAWQRLTEQYGVDAPPNAHQRREIFGIDVDRSLEKHGIVVAGVNYQSLGIQNFRRKVGDTKLRVRFDPLDLGWVSVWLGERWLTVPAVREMFCGVSLETWQRSSADLRARFKAAAELQEHIVFDAIQAIKKISTDAMLLSNIGATRPTVEEIRSTEAHLSLGFHIIDDEQIICASLHDDVPGEVFEATSAAKSVIPIPAEKLTATGSDDYDLED